MLKKIFRKVPKSAVAVFVLGFVIISACSACSHKTSSSDDTVSKDETDDVESQEESVVSLNITEHYATSTGDPSNLYYIDENNVLWGSGENIYGQLGQGTQDYEFYSEKVKIAENIVHVDYSQRGFVIFLTKDYKLYGMGNAGYGALQQYEKFAGEEFANEEQYAVTEPVLLMENVIYACCGRDDVVCLKEDGTVWTWGYNGSGSCGVADLFVVDEPTKVAEDVVMVWTDLSVENDPQPTEEEIAMAWTGKLKYNTEHEDIAEFNDIYPYFFNNTVIQKADGSYWVCGENVGSEEKIIQGAEGDYTVICTHEFYQCE